MHESGDHILFQGSSALSLDAKGRLTVPTRHRDALAAQCAGELTLTRHPDGCLLIYPRPTWETKRAEIARLPAGARVLQRLMLGNAQDVEIDGAGRILVGPELRTAAGLSKEVMLLGMGGHFELWDAVTLQRREAEDLAKGMTDILDQFSF